MFYTIKRFFTITIDYWHYEPAFILAYADIVSSVSQDRDHKADRSEAVSRYMEEAFTLLPRRYENIVEVLHRDGFLSKAESDHFKEAGFTALMGGSVHIYPKRVARSDTSKTKKIEGYHSP